MIDRFLVKLGLRGLTITALIALARLIVTKMTGNANFTTPNPPLASITSKANDLEAKKAEVEQLKSDLMQATSEQSALTKDLRGLLTNEGKYVDITANGDKAKIESAGMGTQDEATPIVHQKVENLSLTHGDDEGDTDMHWNPILTCKNYSIFIGSDPFDPAKMTEIAEKPSKSSLTLKGTRGITGRMWVQAAANFADGQGPKSDPATILVA
jgi:hypothetical protein